MVTYKVFIIQLRQVISGSMKSIISMKARK